MKLARFMLALCLIITTQAYCMQGERQLAKFQQLDGKTQATFSKKLRAALIKFELREPHEQVMPAECDPKLEFILDRNVLLQINMITRKQLTEQQKKIACKSLLKACESDKDAFDLAVKAILAGADINCKDKSTTPAVTIAAIYNNIYVCILLYLLGANLNTTNALCFTALHYSVNRKHYLTTKVLLQLGADPNIASLCGLTPLDQLKTEKNPSTETLKKLLEEYS